MFRKYDNIKKNEEGNQMKDTITQPTKHNTRRNENEVLLLINLQDTMRRTAATLLSFLEP